MAKLQVLLILLFVLGALNSACRTTKPHGAIVDGEAVPLRLDEGAGTNSVPSFLWSPSRRRSSAGYFYLVAEYQSLEGDHKNALPLFESAYNLDPNPFLGGKLISSRVNVGDASNAMQDAKKMVLLYPKSGWLHFLYGRMLAGFGMYREGVAELERAIDLEPENEAYYLELADIHQSAKENIKAKVVVKDLVANAPHSIAGWLKLAKLYLVTGERRKALQPARRAYEMRSSHPETVLIYALALEANGDSKKAIALYEQLYKINPTNEELLGRMVELYRSLGDLQESLTLLDELAKLPGGEHPAIHLQRAIILWELKRFKEASQLLVGLTKKFPENGRLRYMAGLGLEKLEDLDGALRLYQGIPEESQFRKHASLRSALVLRQKKAYQRAYDQLADILNSADADAEAFLLGATLLADLERFGDAVDLTDRGFKRFPKKVRLLFLKGVYQERAGNVDDCIETMRQVIALEPRNAAALNYLGYLYAEQGIRLDEAEDLIKKALEVKPNDGYYLDSLAWVYYQRKDYAEALALLKKALSIIPNEGVVLEHLGDVYKAMGQPQVAFDFYKKALSARLDRKEKKRVEKKLADLQP